MLKRLTFIVLALIGLAGIGRAERFLTFAEARKVCFPEADSWASQTVSLTAEQRAAVEKSAGLKVSNPRLEVWIAQKGGQKLGAVMLDRVIGKHEYIDYVVAVSPDGTLKQVEVLEYRERYGGEIRNSKWRDQFKGKTSGAPLKLNNDIYNISGATMSCRHVAEGVRRVLAIYSDVVGPRFFAGRLPNRANAP